MPVTVSELPPQRSAAPIVDDEPVLDATPTTVDGTPAPRRRRWLPRWTLRLRLTLTYGALFLAAGAVLLAITYALVSHSVTGSVAFKGPGVLLKATHAPPALPFPRVGPNERLFYSVRSNKSGAPLIQLDESVPRAVKSVSGAALAKITAAQRAQLDKVAANARVQITSQRQATLDALLTKSVIALGIMALISIGLGWLMAGRALRPVRTMGVRARGISERNLHERLALEGPDDELKELADTFDGLLGRLERAFESQRRFVANASHELRTPITVERTLVEVALADPKASVGSLRKACERVLASSEQQERLIEALLTLARSQRGIETREKLDLAEITRDVLRSTAPGAVRIRSSLGSAPVSGDPALAERLVANLVDNALHYNVADGWVEAWTGMKDGRPTLLISNSGSVIPPESAAALIEPFRRLNGSRMNHTRGLGPGPLDRRRDRERARGGAARHAARGWRTRGPGPLPEAADVVRFGPPGPVSTLIPNDGTAKRCVADPGGSHRR